MRSAFEESAINWALLPDPTDELLELLGIAALGHRMLSEFYECLGDEPASVEQEKLAGAIDLQSL